MKECGEVRSGRLREVIQRTWDDRVTCCRIMSAVLFLLGVLTLPVMLAAAAEATVGKAPRRGDTVFQTGFEAPAERQGWSQADWAEWLSGYHGTTSLRVTVAPDAAQSPHMIRLPLDLSRYRGCKLLCECQARAENVTHPPEPYNGVKFMLYYRSTGTMPYWQPYWHNQNNVFGSFDWRKLSFTVTIPKDAADGEINLGLQNSSGTVWFDDLKVSVESAPRPAASMENPGPVFRGHDLPRLRGVNSPNTDVSDEDIRVLGQEWHVNVIRWEFMRNWGKVGTERDLVEYDQWIDAKLANLDNGLKACGRYGIKVVVDIHSPPGGRYKNNDMAMFYEPRYQDHWVALWEKIARRYKGNRMIWGYDLINEPVQNSPSPEGVPDFLGAQVRAARAIRTIDPEVPIFIEVNNWDHWSGFYKLDPVDVSNIIYQVHFYDPAEFTHQGVQGRPTGVVYPGPVGKVEWNKERIRKKLRLVRDFQLAYNVHIFVGEFSAIRWAPGDSACQYLQDCIELFEEYGWDWSYFAFRGDWVGFSVEHGRDPNDNEPTKEPTDCKKLLLKWFAKNRMHIPAQAGH